MPNKERIMIMIRLAMLEDEHGTEITKNPPKLRDYVADHLFVFFLVESLLYLCFSAICFATYFMQNGFALPMQQGVLMGAALLVGYIIVSYLGLSRIKRSITRKYEIQKKARKEYKKGLLKLEELMENEPGQ